MSRKLSEANIILEVAEHVCRQVTRKVIAQLRGMHEGLQSGDDSGLKSIWDEICVQIQDEYSPYWDAYEHVVTSIVKYHIEKLLDHEREAIWLQTKNGNSWDCDDDDPRHSYPVDMTDIVDYVLDEYVYEEAGKWSNARIRAYLDRLQ